MTGGAMTTYNGQERRHGAVSEDRVRLMIHEAVSDALAAHESRIMAHLDQQFATLRETWHEAFPDGNALRHRLKHEREIAEATWWSKIKGDAASTLTAAGLLAVVLFIAAAVWEAVKQEAGK